MTTAPSSAPETQPAPTPAPPPVSPRVVPQLPADALAGVSRRVTALEGHASAKGLKFLGAVTVGVVSSLVALVLAGGVLFVWRLLRRRFSGSST